MNRELGNRRRFLSRFGGRRFFPPQPLSVAQRRGLKAEKSLFSPLRSKEVP